MKVFSSNRLFKSQKMTPFKQKIEVLVKISKVYFVGCILLWLVVMMFWFGPQIISPQAAVTEVEQEFPILPSITFRYDAELDKAYKDISEQVSKDNLAEQLNTSKNGEVAGVSEVKEEEKVEIKPKDITEDGQEIVNVKPTEIDENEIVVSEISEIVPIEENQENITSPIVEITTEGQNPTPAINEIENPYSNYEYISKLYLQDPDATIKTIELIQLYTNMYRSKEGKNFSVPLPVKPEMYLETSLKYRVPLAYVITIARLESRFGTHCYAGANITRICAHKNVFSLGLDDSGNNITYDRWESGFDGFGRWYIDKVNRGMGTCQIWKMYNPNGDYCGKVKGIASQVEKFMENGLRK